jgi:ABC-2 type transport system permease protein
VEPTTHRAERLETPPLPSPLRMHTFRAWCYLVWLSIQRQARARLMVWVSLGLLALMTFLIALNTRAGRWNMAYWRWPGRGGATYTEWLETLGKLRSTGLGGPDNLAVQQAVGAACEAILAESGFYVFSRWIVFSIFATFLLPIWALSFAAEGLGRERESGSLIWLLTRPLPRPASYLAKFVAILPWSLGLCLGGFGLLCLAAGPPGRLAFVLYWPAVLLGTLAFCALFHLLGAWLRRAAVAAILYTFFLEAFVGNLPGYLKRLSISFYVRCLMFDRAGGYGMKPERPLTFLPVSGTTALLVLAGATVLLLVVGMFLFSRKEYVAV